MDMVLGRGSFKISHCVPVELVLLEEDRGCGFDIRKVCFSPPVANWCG
jgi:hypothetical protein